MKEDTDSNIQEIYCRFSPFPHFEKSQVRFLGQDKLRVWSVRTKLIVYENSLYRKIKNAASRRINKQEE